MTNHGVKNRGDSTVLILYSLAFKASQFFKPIRVERENITQPLKGLSFFTIIRVIFST